MRYGFAAIVLVLALSVGNQGPMAADGNALGIAGAVGEASNIINKGLAIPMGIVGGMAQGATAMAGLGNSLIGGALGATGLGGLGGVGGLGGLGAAGAAASAGMANAANLGGAAGVAGAAGMANAASLGGAAGLAGAAGAANAASAASAGGAGAASSAAAGGLGGLGGLGGGYGGLGSAAAAGAGGAGFMNPGFGRLGSVGPMGGLGVGGYYPGMVGGGAMTAASAGSAAAMAAGSGALNGGFGGFGGYGGYGGGAAGVMGGAASSAAAAAGGAGIGGLGAGSAAASSAGVGAASAGLGVAGAALGGALVSPRAALAADAVGNAGAEAAIAGADMVAHGINNARSASLASNAYRQAKLASARDRVNIAGTIQNTARISDAAIASHDAATKAEDSLLGSEIAVDSAGTVLDSDAAYIPPVTNSLLRSLPYGRIGLRNIVPKPLTYPSVLLPDVWLNGRPVNYFNVPFRMLPFGVGPTALTNQFQLGGGVLGFGGSFLGVGGGLVGSGFQPFFSNNGAFVNDLVIDPALAYLYNGPLPPFGSSILPVLANGQVQAGEEVALANMITRQQNLGAGMAATYTGYGSGNPVPLLTGSASIANLVPVTTIGTTYPIGSALVIEPRDSFFQDYIDNASSRQNFDERQQ